MVDGVIDKIEKRAQAFYAKTFVNDLDAKTLAKTKKAVVIDTTGFNSDSAVLSLLSNFEGKKATCPIILINENRNTENLSNIPIAITVSSAKNGGVLCSVLEGKCERLIKNRVAGDLPSEYLKELFDFLPPVGSGITCAFTEEAIRLRFYSQSKLENFVLRLTELTNKLDEKYSCFTMFETKFYQDPLVPDEKISEFLLFNGLDRLTCAPKEVITASAKSESVVFYGGDSLTFNAITRFMEEY